MTTEEELINLRKKLEEGEKRVKSEKRTNAVVFGVLAIVGLVALVYGFFQQVDARKARIEVEVGKTIAEEQVTEMKKQLLFEKEKSAACERSLDAVQPSNAKPGK